MKNFKCYFYGTYRYREMKRAKKYITATKDCIPCCALHPILQVIATSKTDAKSKIKARGY
jgi:hypothetical protein